MDKLNIVGIAGSLRKGSYNRMLLEAAKEIATDSMTIEEFDLSGIPMYNTDVEKSAVPQIVTEFKEKIRAADGLLISTPEYNYSVPGVLKNAIDWASRMPKDTPLHQKPVAMMGGSGGISGTIRAQGHLRQILAHSNMLDLKKPEVLVTKIQEKFDGNGVLTDDALKQHLIRFLAAFENWIRIFKK
ncbi:MAG: NAD(P)H-dependent oxidoreductase [Ignavibacteria bacterium]|nr:NAD(P)H-dependent oxidoreductase [Ignavibacteria bacterium]